MTDGAAPSRRALLRRSGILAVVTAKPDARRDGTAEDTLDLHVCLTDEGRIYAFCGHVDLGTGIRTALAQIVAEELDVPLGAVEVVLGDTENTPDQGPTVASETIQVTAVPLRIAAAQARNTLVGLAAAALDAPLDALAIEDGVVRVRDRPDLSADYASLLRNRRLHLPLDRSVVPKPVAAHRIVGQPVHRVDIPAKAAGTFVYVHDVRVGGMLHGRVVRPPYSGIDGGEFVGRCLESVDRNSVADIPGIVAVVVEGDFIGVVAEREEYAAEAAARLVVHWKPWTYGRDLGDLAHALRTNPSSARKLVDKGDVDAALNGAALRLDRAYLWPYQMHGSIGPSCGVADVQPERITVWAGTQNPHTLRADLARLTGLPEIAIEVIRLEAAGCFGRNCADDVVADAVLLSRAVGKPVRVQLTREQEHLWEPKGSGQLVEVSGALGADGSLAAYDFQSRYPTNFSPTLALLLTGRVPPVPEVRPIGDRTALPSYDYENIRVTVHDMPPIVRASWFRGVSGLPNVFAHESFIDELAAQAGVDPVEFRLRHINDPRAAELTKATAARAGWQHRAGPKPQDEDAEIVRGRGFAQARYVHGNWPGFGAAWSAWVAEVAVNRTTGEVNVTRVVAGQDTGLMINPAGVRHQLHGNVVQSVSRVLKEEVRFSETTAVAARDWGAYPILKFPELPAIDVMLMDRPHEPPLGAGESATVPSAAAIVNAVYDATGVRFRELPLTPERVLAALGKPAAKPAPPPTRRRLPSLGTIAAMVVGVLGLGAVALPIHSAIAPIAQPDPATWSAATIEKGRLLAALGACAVCHTADNGVAYAGGRPLPTPFGTVIATNISPDVETGIGTWSYPAFERAMRQGIHRDGRNLYPVFPYPSFAQAAEADLQALYAYLMSQPAVRQTNAISTLAFPFNLRPLVSVWNWLFNRTAPHVGDPARSAEWNRGRYLVDGLGHCGACHTPRNLLGAERASAYLAGGVAEGWDAPALTSLSLAPLSWTEDALFAYLRTGTSLDHGAAAGPMGPIVRELKALPDSDIRAMAVYLASLNTPLADAQARRAALVASSASALHPPTSAAARLYEGACATCHDPERAALSLNVGPPLALNTAMHSDRPDNFLRVLLEGIAETPHGTMPAFRAAFDDAQIADLARYARSRFAPERPAWENLEDIVARLRAAPASQTAAPAM
jgi:nicotinate dehydrogenase subunit B